MANDHHDKPATVERYRQAARRLREHIRYCPVWELGHGVELYRERRGQEVTDRVVEWEIGRLRHALGLAHDLGKIPELPKLRTRRVVRPRTADSKSLNREQITRLLHLTEPNQRYAALGGLVRPGLFAGLRMGESLAARWRWVDLTARVLTVRREKSFSLPSRAPGREQRRHTRAVRAVRCFGRRGATGPGTRATLFGTRLPLSSTGRGCRCGPSSNSWATRIWRRRRGTCTEMTTLLVMGWSRSTSERALRTQAIRRSRAPSTRRPSHPYVVSTHVLQRSPLGVLSATASFQACAEPSVPPRRPTSPGSSTSIPLAAQAASPISTLLNCERSQSSRGVVPPCNPGNLPVRRRSPRCRGAGRVRLGLRTAAAFALCSPQVQ